MSRSRVVRPSRQSLVVLRSELDEARQELAHSRTLDGLDRTRLASAQRRTLVALERYVAALRAAGCTPHWQLTQEIGLLQGIVAADGAYRTAYRS